jgi:hypothetical protein
MKKPPPFRIVLNADRPRGLLGGSLSGYVPPGAQYDYKPPSVFARYKWLTAIFALLILGLLLYVALAPRQPRVYPAARTPPGRVQAPAPSNEPVYVEPLAPVKR